MLDFIWMTFPASQYMYMADGICIWQMAYVYERLHMHMHMADGVCIWRMAYVYGRWHMYMADGICIWQMAYVYSTLYSEQLSGTLLTSKVEGTHRHSALFINKIGRDSIQIQFFMHRKSLIQYSICVETRRGQDYIFSWTDGHFLELSLVCALDSLD